MAAVVTAIVLLATAFHLAAASHISAERLRERLKRYGITSRPSRHAALLALGARLPAPILAERLGFQQARAAQWVRAAGAGYADYVALRHASYRAGSGGRSEPGGELAEN